MFNLLLNFAAYAFGLNAMKERNCRKFKKFLKIMGAVFAISAYKFITALFFGMGPKLSALVCVIVSGFLLCKGKRFFRTVFKNEWINQNSNVQAQEGERHENNNVEGERATPLVVEMTNQTA